MEYGNMAGIHRKYAGLSSSDIWFKNNQMRGR
jgi:hypothetical protein